MLETLQTRRARGLPAQRRAVITILLLVGTLALTSAASGLAARRAHAQASAVLAGTAKAHLHLVPPIEGSTLYEEGPVTGALTGTVKAKLRTGSKFTAQFTIRTHVGTITGRGSANPHGSGRYQSFSGSFIATSGTGRYAHIRGQANLYGVIDQRTEDVTIETVGNGKLTY